MVNKYKPKNVCPQCQKEVWDYHEQEEHAKCKDCKTKIKKKLHPLVGAKIYKNQQKQFVLEFEQFNEKNIYPDWDNLKRKLDELEQNEVE